MFINSPMWNWAFKVVNINPLFLCLLKQTNAPNQWQCISHYNKLIRLTAHCHCILSLGLHLAAEKEKRELVDQSILMSSTCVCNVLLLQSLFSWWLWILRYLKYPAYIRGLYLLNAWARVAYTHHFSNHS